LRRIPASTASMITDTDAFSFRVMLLLTRCELLQRGCPTRCGCHSRQLDLQGDGPRMLTRFARVVSTEQEVRIDEPLNPGYSSEEDAV
jgi:hypothetical protein